MTEWWIWIESFSFTPFFVDQNFKILPPTFILMSLQVYWSLKLQYVSSQFVVNTRTTINLYFNILYLLRYSNSNSSIIFPSTKQVYVKYHNVGPCREVRVGEPRYIHRAARLAPVPVTQTTHNDVQLPYDRCLPWPTLISIPSSHSHMVSPARLVTVIVAVIQGQRISRFVYGGWLRIVFLFGVILIL